MLTRESVFDYSSVVGGVLLLFWVHGGAKLVRMAEEDGPWSRRFALFDQGGVAATMTAATTTVASWRASRMDVATATATVPTLATLATLALVPLVARLLAFPACLLAT